MATGKSSITFVPSSSSKSSSSSGSKDYPPPSYSSTPGPAGGRYVTQVINGKSYVTFVPEDVKIYAGSKSRGTAQLVVDTTPAQPAPKTERMVFGDIVVSKDVPISGSVFKMLEERRLGGPMSMRTDVPYSVTVRQDTSGLVNQSVAPPTDGFGGGSFRGSGHSGGFKDKRSISQKIQAWFDQDSNAFMDRQIEFLQSWERSAGKRAGQVDDFFIKNVQQSPFRAGRPLNFMEEVGARGLAVPGHLVTTAPEHLALAAGKAVVFAETSYFPKYAARAKQAHEEAIAAVPLVLASSFDVRKPSGIVNVAGAIAAPSFYGKLVTSAKSVLYVGKSKIPIEATVDPRVLSGQQRFPTSRGTAPALKGEFKNSPYVKNVNAIIKGDAPAANTFLPKNRGVSQIGLVGKGRKALANLGNKGKVVEDLPASGSQVLYVDNWGHTYVVANKAASVRGGFHASRVKIQTSKGALRGTSETPGMHIAPSLSTHFLKLMGKDRTVKVGLLPSVQTPSANLVDTKVGLIPKGFVRDAEIAAGARIGAGGSASRVSRSSRGAALGELNKYFEGDLVGSGKSAVSPEFYLGKGESESIIGHRSGLRDLRPNYNIWDRITGFKYYQEIGGSKVPFRILEATPNRAPGISGRISQFAAERSISSSRRIGDVEVPVVGVAGLGSSRGGGGSRGGGSSFRISQSQSSPPISGLSSSGSSPSVGYPIISVPGSRTPSNPEYSLPGAVSRGGGSGRRSIFSGSGSYVPERMGFANPSRTPGDAQFLGFIGREPSRRSSVPKTRLVPFKPKYFASIEATALGIKGKPNKLLAIDMGLDIRPLRI